MDTSAAFVNPYTFVPLPIEVIRRQPLMHAGAHRGRLYSGVIDMEWTLETPMVLPREAEAEGWLTDEGVRIPGSALKGMARSLHETMFNGCLRVLDEDFVPSYREPTHAGVDGAANWTLAVVTESRDGQPQRLRLCEDIVWVEATSLARALRRDRAVRSGDWLELEGAITTSTLDRREMCTVSAARRVATPGSAAVSEGARVVLVTDTTARRRKRKNGAKGRCFWATATATERVVDLDPVADQDAIQAYRAACRGTDDRRRLEQQGKRSGKSDARAWERERDYADVEWWTPGGGFGVIAQRARASGLLFPGDVVWVRMERDRVRELKLARIWRRAGDGSVRERLGSGPTSPLPCIPGEDLTLCHSCAVFGAADTSAGDAGKGRQDSYAGHVRFGAARSGPVTTTSVRLAPLGQPRPGMGMFYLQWRKDSPQEGRPVGDVASHWGSKADHVGPIYKRLAGRKYYWHSDPDAQADWQSAQLGGSMTPRYTATGSLSDDKGGMVRPAILVPKGTVLTARVSVDQLDPMSLHTLLAALDPTRVMRLIPGGEGRRVAVRLGGAKPLGLGSATPRVTRVDVGTLHERYLGGSGERIDWTNARFPGADVNERVGRFGPNLEQLLPILDLDGLGDQVHLVTYPPGAPWAFAVSDDPKDQDRFRRSFEFFQECNGARETRSTKPWHRLPGPTDGDRSLPITTKDKP